MPVFNLSSEAKDFILAAIRRSNVENPAVGLAQQGAFVTPDPETLKAIRAGDKHAIDRVAAESGRSIKLVPAVFPRDQVPLGTVVNIDGIAFCLPADLSKIDAGFSLELSHEGLILRDSTGEIVLPKREA